VLALWQREERTGEKVPTNLLAVAQNDALQTPLSLDNKINEGGVISDSTDVDNKTRHYQLREILRLY
jgi:hypothetical protein